MIVIKIIGYALLAGAIAVPIIALVNEIRYKRSSRPKI